MSSWFAKGKNFFGTGDIDFINDDIIAVLIDLSKYTPDFDNDCFLDDIPEEARIASASLSGKTMSSRIGYAANTTIPQVDYNESISAVVLAKDTTEESSSPIFLLIDQGNFPLIPAGEDVILQWSVDGLFVL